MVNNLLLSEGVAILIYSQRSHYLGDKNERVIRKDD